MFAFSARSAKKTNGFENTEGRFWQSEEPSPMYTVSAWTVPSYSKTCKQDSAAEVGARGGKGATYPSMRLRSFTTSGSPDGTLHNNTWAVGAWAVQSALWAPSRS